jgi:hypothetical protein
MSKSCKRFLPARIGRAAIFLTGMGIAGGSLAADLPGSKVFSDRLENGRVMAFASTDLAPGRLGAAVVCLDGRSFAVAAMMGHGNTATPAVGIVQVYEERGGQPVPARCQ